MNCYETDKRVYSTDSARCAERLLSRSLVDPITGCWTWQGPRTVGYGRIKYAKRLDLTHRVAYLLWVDELVPGMEIDHLCRNRACCNPTHLEQVTPIVNKQRALVQTHCHRGHSLDDACVAPTGWRSCRECRRIRTQVRKAADRAARLALREGRAA